MTSREATKFLPLADDGFSAAPPPGRTDLAYRLAFGAIGWPWLLYSLWGGTKASKRRLLARVGLDEHALPNLGSWKADTGFLHRIVDAVEEVRPANVVELGAGASSLVCARALELHGGGQLHSYDQHAAFVAATAEWVAGEGCTAHVRHAPLTAQVEGWPGRWYDLHGLPDTIDLLIIDGPPWAIHPYVRGAAACLFDRLSPGAIVLLDDAARPGERVVARRWRKAFPEIAFTRHTGSTKGTLVGRKRASAEVIALRPRVAERAPGQWRRAAAAAGLLATGWIGHDIAGDLASPASAASFIDEADASYTASVVRGRMESQLESPHLDRAEIRAATGLVVPQMPGTWQVTDVQVYPSDLGLALALVVRTERGETITIFGTRADTPAEERPLLESRDQRSIAYWETGPNAYAVTGRLPAERVLELAVQLAS